MKQRREKALQNAKDRKLAKGYPLAALKANHRANRASNDSQNSTNTNDELIDGSNTDTIIGVENMDNTAIAAENTDNAVINADNTSNATTDSKKSDDAAMSNDNTDNTAMSNNNTDDATIGDGNTENTTTGETSMVEIPSPLCYGRKTKDPSKVKTSKRHTPIMVEPSEPSIGDPPPNMAVARVKLADKMVMLPPLFGGSKPEVAKQHYERFNQYIKFQTKSGNIRDPIAGAIEINCYHGTFLFLTLKRLMLMNTLI